jgi:hypothetical protein
MKKTTKSISATTNETTQSNTPANAGIDPVPQNLPAVPKGRLPVSDKIGRKGRRPRNGLNEVATGLAKELRDNAPALRAELGPKVVDPLHLAAALDSAVGWTSAEEQAASFHAYARSQRGRSWDSAVGLCGGVHLAVRFALARDATFAERFPVTGKAFAPQKRPKKSDAGTAGVAGAAAPKTKAKPAAAETAPAEPSATPETSPAATTA